MLFCDYFFFTALSTNVATTTDEKERFVSSIIKTLEADEVLRFSTANSRAYIFRAELYGQTGRFEESVADAKAAIQILSASSKDVSSLLAKAHRVLADTYEQTGNWKLAVEALRGVATSNPSLRSKITKEIELLRQRAESVDS